MWSGIETLENSLDSYSKSNVNLNNNNNNIPRKSTFTGFTELMKNLYFINKDHNWNFTFVKFFN